MGNRTSESVKHRSGMLSHVDTGQGEPELSAKDVLSLVHIICTNCYFVASFAWKAVLAAVRAAEATHAKPAMWEPPKRDPKPWPPSQG